MISAPRWILTSVLALLLTLTWSPAQAEEPVDLTGRVDDRVGVLDGDEDRVRTAIETFYEETGRQLFVVYVRSFEGMTGSEWARQSADRSALGPTDVVFAVATDARSWGIDAAPDDLTAEDLRTIDTERVLPQLRAGDWAGAAEGAAEGLTEATEGTGIRWGWIVVAVLLLAVGAAVTVTRVRRRFDHSHHVVDEHGRPVDPAAILSDEELEVAASHALVAADDALWTSTRELEWAPEGAASARLRAVVEQARATLDEAFALQQLLDDAQVETDAERRGTASRVVALCEQADDALDAHAADLDALRGPQSPADALSAVATAIDAVQVGRSERAASLLEAARAEVRQGRAALAEDEDSLTAASHARAAEQLTSQARVVVTTPTDGIESLQAAVETLRGAIRSATRTRLAAARRTDDTALAGRLLAEARESLDADLAQWRARRGSPAPEDADTERMLLTGVLVPLAEEDRHLLDRLEPDEAEEVLGAHQRTATLGHRRSERRRAHTPGRFGGRRTRGRRGTAPRHP